MSAARKMTGYLSGIAPDWFWRDLTLLIRAMLRAYHRTIPDRQLSIAVTTTASVVRQDQMRQFWGRTVTLRAITSDVRIIVGDAMSVASGGYLLTAGQAGQDFYVRVEEQWSVVGSGSATLLVLWSSRDGLPVASDDYGT